MSEELYDILEICLEELDKGAELESVLARYPKFAAELRPILNASMQAKQISAPKPSREATMRGRAKLMQQVAEIREEKSAPRKRVIPFFQRIAISFAVTVSLLLSGTTLVGASSNALPGHTLYPVKRGWEDIRLFFAFDEEAREELEHEFENERLHEVNELLSDEEHKPVDFYGPLTIVNGRTYVSDVEVIFPKDAQIPNEGESLHVNGATDDGYVEVSSFEVLQGPVTPTKPDMPINPASEDGDHDEDD